MIEINRRLYMDEQTGERLPSFDQVGNAVSGMSSELTNLRSCVGEKLEKRRTGRSKTDLSA